MDPVALVRAALGIALLGLLPGYAWSRLLLARLRPAERLATSIAFSIVLMALLLYVGNALFGIRIGARSAIWYALLATFAAAAPPLARRFQREVDRRVG